jgi:hypothetical protein
MQDWKETYLTGVVAKNFRKIPEENIWPQSKHSTTNAAATKLHA